MNGIAKFVSNVFVTVRYVLTVTGALVIYFAWNGFPK